jgi:hypothetical protein
MTFAFPKEKLQNLPECLQLDTFQDKWAFVAVAKWFKLKTYDRKEALNLWAKRLF